ncbi:MAG TPA: hypothetical protein VKB80_18380 [Kofleriaceae bacterium]|nr:hypothetical protein [Kofleriaceae bacterium]
MRAIAAHVIAAHSIAAQLIAHAIAAHPIAAHAIAARSIVTSVTHSIAARSIALRAIETTGEPVDIDVVVDEEALHARCREAHARGERGLGERVHPRDHRQLEPYARYRRGWVTELRTTYGPPHGVPALDRHSPCPP